MLIREVANGYLMISQPAHAWVSAQLASAWGNEQFGELQPRREVMLAAEQHDIGWLEWEARPELNAKTGRPQTFMEIPTSAHLDIWTPAGPAALVYGPYVALFVSKHGTGLYQRHDFTDDTPEEAHRARTFQVEGAAFEQRLIEAMAGTPSYAPWLDDDTIARNSKLISVWDMMSLSLCGGSGRNLSISDVPAGGAATTLNVVPDSANVDLAIVSPWPFEGESLLLTCPARRMTRTFSSNADLQAAVAQAPWELIEIELVPG